MIITFNPTGNDNEGDYVECHISDDASFDDIMNVIKGLLITLGYHPDTVKEYFDEPESSIS